MTWQFFAPTRSWVTLSAGEIAGGVLAGPVLRALVNNAEFLRESLVGENTTAASVPHTHEGTDTPPIEVGTWSRNLVTNSAPDADTTGNWQGVGDWWPRVKYKKKKPPNVHVAPGKGFVFSGRKNAHVWTIPTTRADISKMIWGGGAELCLSAYVKAPVALTSGEFSFGIATGQGWMEGARFAVDYTDLTTTHKRFYGFATISPEVFEAGATSEDDSAGVEPQNAARFELRVTDDADGAIEATHFQLSLGHRLRWWMPARMDAHGNGSTHDDWTLYGAGCPAWDKTISFTNAVRLYGV